MKKTLAVSALMLLSVLGVTKAQESPEEAHIFTLKTGYYNGLYYYSGLLIAAVNDHPPQSLACGEGGSCGEDGLLIANQSSSGSMENLSALCSGKVDSAIVQSNLAYMAYTATGPFAGQEPCKQLRALASLYPEMLQIAVPKDSDIHQLRDLQGKIIAVGSKLSGTFDGLREIFATAGMDIGKLHLINESLGQSAKDFVEKKIDALAFFTGVPTPIFEQLNHEIPLRFLAISGSEVDKMLDKSPYYRRSEIPKESYQNIEPVNTISVHALWVSTDKIEKKRIYQLTKNLWHKDTYPSWFNRLLLKNSFEFEHSLDGIGIPLHDGAKKYYNEIGKRF